MRHLSNSVDESDCTLFTLLRPANLGVVPDVLGLPVVFPSDIFCVVGVERRMSFHPDRASGQVHHSVCSGFLIPLLSRCAIFPGHADNHVS